MGATDLNANNMWNFNTVEVTFYLWYATASSNGLKRNKQLCNEDHYYHVPNNVLY